MNRFDVCLTSCAMIACPAILSAQSATLEICNKGPIPVNVAYAARIQLFITGYRWETSGWYPLDAGACEVVYDKDYADAGPITPQSGARVALVAKTGATWRAFHKSASSTNVATAPASGSEITYLCLSTDKRKVVFVSDLFALPDAGSQADNFMTFARMQNRFQLFLNTHYDFPGDDGMVACLHTPSTSTSAAEMSATERRLEANLVAANKHMVETGWRYVREDVASDTTFHYSVTRDDVAALTPGGRAALFNWVQDDVAKYLAASKTGFSTYKGGDVILQQGYRMWTSSVKPEIARGCWVVQGDSSTTLSCAIPIDKNYERAYYNELVQDVAATLPAGWSAGPPNPFGGALPSTGWLSNNGAHGEVWLVEPKDDTYEVNFQLVSAPIRH